MMMITCRILWIPVIPLPRCRTTGRCVASADSDGDRGPASDIRPDPASAARGAGVATGPDPRTGTDAAQAATRPESRTAAATADNGLRRARPVPGGWTVDGRTRRPAGTAR